jgi:PadR family transcriptional regulator PadR
LDRPWISQLKKGVTELAVLAALTDGEAYGYELLQRLEKSDYLATTPATLYPVLARLTDERLIAVREAPSPAGPPRRYYRVTAAGVKHRESMIAYWKTFTAAVDSLIQNPGRHKESAA